MSKLEPLFSTELQDFGDFFKLEGFKTPFSSFDSALVSQVYGIIVNEKNEILLVLHRRGDYLLPGGTVEIGESLIETLERELYEEAAVKIDLISLKEGFWQQVYKLENSDSPEIEWKKDVIQVRYLARANQIDKFIKDPAGGMIIAQKWVKIEDLDTYLKWGQANQVIKNLAKEFIS